MDDQKGHLNFKEKSFTSTNVLEQHLPARFEPITDKDKATECLSTILKQSLPNSQKSEVDNDKYWSYILDRHSSENKKPVQKFSKKKTLSRKDKQQLGLLKLPKDGWQYEKLTAMNDMWKNYMRENLELVNRTEVDCSTLSTILSKSELIGAEVTIDRSIVPNYVGMQGIIVLESKSTFQIVTKKSKLKIIMKEGSVFTITLDSFKFTIFGRNMVTRPGERSVKKIKSYITLDL